MCVKDHVENFTYDNRKGATTMFASGKAATLSQISQSLLYFDSHQAAPGIWPSIFRNLTAFSES